MSLFPLFLKLEGHPCLVVGAGTVAAPKIESLLHAGGRVTVVAPEALPGIAARAGEKKIRWIQREFVPSDLEDALLVVTATNEKAVNHAVAEAARAAGILCNSVDDPPGCDFYYGSVVERGDLQVAISTAGKSPALAQRLREELSALIADDAGAWLDQLGERRLRVLAAVPPGEERKQALHLLARREACNPDDCPVEAVLNKALEDKAEAGRAREGKAYLVGAGPGFSDLLTVRAHRLIESATCVLHDDLVSAEVLALTRADALVVNVGKRCGQKLMTQQRIHELMIAYAREGRSVVRLKSGDPLLFGRAAEEMAALNEAGVAYEIVPGVSAAFAAAAAVPVSLTDRDRSARVVLTTRHRAGNLSVAEESLEGEAATIASSSAFRPGLDADSTLAIYMPGRDYGGSETGFTERRLAARGTLPAGLVGRRCGPADCRYNGRGIGPAHSAAGSGDDSGHSLRKGQG